MFTGWSGTDGAFCGNATTCQVTMNRARSVTATFGQTGGCGKILFTSSRAGNGDIFVMNADGTNPMNLTNNSAVDSTPAWSSNCQRIVFVSARGGATNIWVMNADGSGLDQLTTGAGATWSPMLCP